MSTTVCPVREEASRAVELSGDLLKTLRKLRRSLRACDACSQVETCSLWQALHAAVDLAILEVNLEWGLGG